MRMRKANAVLPPKRTLTALPVLTGWIPAPQSHFEIMFGEINPQCHTRRRNILRWTEFAI
jgi:hypothetical protein